MFRYLFPFGEEIPVYYIWWGVKKRDRAGFPRQPPGARRTDRIAKAGENPSAGEIPALLKDAFLW
jgi:hypothetical protein